MRQQLLVDGESVDALVEIFPYFETHRQPNNKMRFTAEHVPPRVLAPFLRALMRREARLLKEDADRVRGDALEWRTQDERRVDALVDLVASVAAVSRYQGSISIKT